MAVYCLSFPTYFLRKEAENRHFGRYSDAKTAVYPFRSSKIIDFGTKRKRAYALLHCESKNCATFIFTVTLANVGRFLKFFQCQNQKGMAHNKNEKFPTIA